MRGLSITLLDDDDGNLASLNCVFPSIFFKAFSLATVTMSRYLERKGLLFFKSTTLSDLIKELPRLSLKFSYFLICFLLKVSSGVLGDPDLDVYRILSSVGGNGSDDFMPL